MINLQRIGHVAFRVADLQKSKDFYTKVLGFELLEEDPEHGGVFLTLPGLGNTLDLFQSTDVQASSAHGDLRSFSGVGSHHTAFAVNTEDDLKSAYAHLQDCGVEVLRLVDHGNQRSVYFHDPDGNNLEVVWERPNSREIFLAGRKNQDSTFTIER